MNNIHPEYVDPSDLLKEFAEKNDKFQERFISLLTQMESFIQTSGIDKEVRVNELMLGYTLVDYFEDVKRLKLFHRVEHISGIKIVAYTAYWLLKRKPIQVVEQDKKLIYINERFVLSFIISYLSMEEKGNILMRDNSGLNAFNESLFYFLKYRQLSAQSLEMIIMAFFAGQIYQEEGEDLSSKRPKASDKEDG